MQYLLTATVLLFALWPAYYLLLRYSERYSLNRLLLLLAMIAVCALPFVEFESPAPVVTQSVRGTISVVGETIAPLAVPPAAASEVFVYDDSVEPAEKVPITLVPVPKLYLIYGGVCLLAFLLLGLRLALILRLHLRSRPNGDESYRLLHPSAKPGQAFTFGRLLYFSIDVPDDGDFGHILSHERVHARQLHTLDILISEVFLCLFWFHPTAWWLRTKMRANLEYLVDKEVVKRGSDRRSYQLALVRQSQAAQGLALALPFSEPSLKSRIVRLSGMPEYRLVGVMAALGLTLWLGVAMLTLNGTLNEPPGPKPGEYLAASASPGDPYYDYYRASLPRDVNSLEVYLNRMVSVDEYLQLRAILSKVPGAKLYLYKQPFDDAYSLELRHGNNEPAPINNKLPTVPSESWVSMLGLEPGAPGTHVPVAADHRIRMDLPNGKTGGMTFFTTATQPNFSLDFRDAVEALADGEIRVYVNREPLQLLPAGSDFISGNDGPAGGDTVNGYPLNELSVEDWPKLVVEGRPMPEPYERLRKILGEDDFLGVGSSFLSFTAEGRTFRKQFKNLNWPEGQSIITRYNDRRVSLDFLLDTEFGEGAFMSTAVIYDTNMGRYALQVIDDSPYDQVASIEVKTGEVEDPMDPNGIQEMDLFFRRLPTPVEVERIRPYLSGFPDYDLRVFQDCQYPYGNYTLFLGDRLGGNKGFSNVSVGESFDPPLHFKLKRESSGEINVRAVKPGAETESTPSGQVLLRVDGVDVSVTSANAESYSAATLDAPPALVSLRCKSNVTPNTFNRGFWSYIYRSTGPEMMENLLAELEAKGFGDRGMTFYIGERPVDIGEFGNYAGDDGSYVQMGTWTEIDHAPVVVQIVE